VNAGPRLDLGHPRDVTELLGDALRLLLAHPLRFLAMSAAIVVPAHLVVSGVGLEHLTAPYRPGAREVETIIATAVSFILVAPLVTAATIHALESVARGERPSAAASVLAALETFTPLLMAVLLSAAGVVLGLAALLLPGIYLAVRWVFVPQAVMIEGARGAEALRSSWRAVEGSWWRCLGVVLLANLAAALPGLVVIVPVDALAEAADREAVSLVGMILIETLTAPFVALVTTLLFFDLRVRREGARAA